MTLQSSGDYEAARRGAVVFDLADRGHVEATGPDAVQFLHNLCTNDIKSLAVGRGCEFFLTTNKARVVGHGFAHRVLAQTPTVMLDVDPGTGAKVAAHLNRFIVSEQVEVFDRSGSIAQFLVAGPEAPHIIEKVLGQALETLADLQHVIHGAVRIGRHDYLQLPSFDLLMPTSDASTWRQRLLEAGAAAGSAETLNILRVEAGVPLDGVDMDAERFVVEVGRIRQAISYAKGCYLGQEPIVMARDRGQANRVLAGLKIDGETPAAAGAKVSQEDQEIGQVTSSVASPGVGSAIALAYLKRGKQEPGTRVEVEGRRAVVTALPLAI